MNSKMEGLLEEQKLHSWHDDSISMKNQCEASSFGD